MWGVPVWCLLDDYIPVPNTSLLLSRCDERAACRVRFFFVCSSASLRRRAWPAQSRQWSPAPAPALALSHEDARPAKCKNRLRRKRPHTKRDGQSVKSGNALRMLRRVVRSGSALLFLSFLSFPPQSSPVLLEVPLPLPASAAESTPFPPSPFPFPRFGRASAFTSLANDPPNCVVPSHTLLPNTHTLLLHTHITLTTEHETLRSSGPFPRRSRQHLPARNCRHLDAFHMQLDER